MLEKEGIIEAEYSDSSGNISLRGKVLNRANSDSVLYSLQLKDVSGYSAFLKFREKYRTLENATRI